LDIDRAQNAGMYESRMPTLIAIAVVQRDEQFLIGQRPPGVALAGLWEFPGGKVHAGESPEEAAARECEEETGLVVIARFRYPERLQDYEHGRVQLHFIHCEPVDAAALPKAPFRWVQRADLASYEFPAGNRPLLDQLLQ
jgi:8-oxo-dGTP diphosphatase